MPERKIRLYVDEDIPSGVVKFIRDKLCWDTKHVCEEKDLQEKGDIYHHRRARQERRILLTRDKDYLDPRRFPFHKSQGIVVIEEKNTERIIHILHLLSNFLRDVLGEIFSRFSFFKIIASTSGARLRYQEGEDRIKEEFYPW